MAKIDIEAVAKAMAAAAYKVLKKQAPEIKSYAQAEGQKLAHTIALIGERYAAGQIDEEHAKLLLRLQKNASMTVFLTVEGLGILTVEAALNAAFDVVRQTVNTAVGFVLL